MVGLHASELPVLENISGHPLFEFETKIKFGLPILSIQYVFEKSGVNITGGAGLNDEKTTFDWAGQMFPSDA